MSATDELRRLLDERGVEYETYIEQPTGFEHVKWNFNEHGSADFNLEFGEPWLTMYGTISGPEQAIAATLGRGEFQECYATKQNYKRCKYSTNRGWFDGECELHDCEGSFSAVNKPVWRCDCGAFMTQYTDATTYYKPRYCPNCGRKVVSE